MNGEFPVITAGDASVVPSRRPSDELQLSEATTVWIQTLNSLHMEEAETEANIYAAVAARRYKKGSDVYDGYKVDFEAMTIDKQVQFLLDHAERDEDFYGKAYRKYLPPADPSRTTERGEPLSEVEYIKAVEHYEIEVRRQDELRSKYTEKLRKDKEKQIRSWQPDTRAERCMEAFMSNFFATTLIKRKTLEVLLRAVRCQEDHYRRYFSSIAQIVELDDDMRGALIQRYNSLDSLDARQIPTLPAE